MVDDIAAVGTNNVEFAAYNAMLAKTNETDFSAYIKAVEQLRAEEARKAETNSVMQAEANKTNISSEVQYSLDKILNSDLENPKPLAVQSDLKNLLDDVAKSDVPAPMPTSRGIKSDIELALVQLDEIAAVPYAKTPEKKEAAPIQEEPKAEVAEAPKVEEKEEPKTEVAEAPNVEEKEEPKTEVAEASKVEEKEEPKAEVAEAPKVEEKEEPKTEVAETQKVEEKAEPKAEVVEASKVEEKEEPKVEVAENPKVEEKEEPKAEVAEAPKVEEKEEPKAEVAEAAKAEANEEQVSLLAKLLEDVEKEEENKTAPVVVVEKAVFQKAEQKEEKVSLLADLAAEVNANKNSHPKQNQVNKFDDRADKAIRGIGDGIISPVKALSGIKNVVTGEFSDGQKEIRNAVADFANAPAQAVNFVSTAVEVTVNDLVGETTGKIVAAPLKVVSGIWETGVSVVKPEEGSIKKAFNKMTFGLFN